jgi:hypothetical protein
MRNRTEFSSAKKQRKSTFIKKSIKVSAESMQNPKSIQDLIFPNATIRERIARRHYQFCEKDIDDIIKTGKIPPIKKLMNLAQQKEEFQKSNQSSDTIKELENTGEKIDDESRSNIEYDRNQTDKTFLTGVHITDRIELESEEDSDIDSPTIYDIALPLTILGSVKSLRMALKNPGAIKRSMIPAVTSKRINITSKPKGKHSL